MPLYRSRVPDPDAGAVPDAPGGVTSFMSRPGQIQLRMTVEGENGQVLDSAIREITVP